MTLTTVAHLTIDLPGVLLVLSEREILQAGVEAVEARPVLDMGSVWSGQAWSGQVVPGQAWLGLP